MLTASRRTLLHWRGRGTVAQAIDTMDALGYETRHGQRPLLSHYHRTSSGWHLAWTLPAGISSATPSHLPWNVRALCWGLRPPRPLSRHRPERG